MGCLMKRLIFSVLLILLSCSYLPAQKKRVAVLDFEFGTVQRWWEGTWDIGKGISDMIVDELVNDGTYSVIERSRLDAVLAEQNFSNSERADPNSAARIGKVLGVDAIIVGSITQFGVEKKGFSLGGLGRSVGGFGAGKVGTQEGQAKVQLTARIVNIDTAEILVSEKGQGESKRSGLMLGGAGGSGGNAGAGGISMTSSDFRQTIIGEATEAAVTELGGKLVKRGDRLPTRKVDIRGLVADVAGTTLIFNVGSGTGLQVGDIVKIQRVTRTIKDPASGKVLREISETVGRARITEVDAVSSVAEAIDGSGIKVGDLVRNE